MRAGDRVRSTLWKKYDDKRVGPRNVGTVIAVRPGGAEVKFPGYRGRTLWGVDELELVVDPEPNRPLVDVLREDP